MESVGSEHLLLEGPVLIDLGRKLHEIALHVSPGHPLVAALAQEAVESVAELMEGGLHLVYGQQRRLLGGRCVEIAYIHDDRTHVVAVRIHVLVAEVVHPGAGTLALAGEVVGDDDADERAVLIADLEGLSLRIEEGDALDRLELKSVETAGKGEDACADVLHLEILHHFGLVQGIAGTAHLLGVVHIVPRLYGAAFREQSGLDILVHNGLHVSHFLLGTGHGRSHYPGKEAVHCLRVAGHLGAENLGCRSLEAQELRPLDSQLHSAQYDGLVVVGIAVVSAVRIETEHLLAQGTV